MCELPTLPGCVQGELSMKFLLPAHACWWRVGAKGQGMDGALTTHMLYPNMLVSREKLVQIINWWHGPERLTVYF